MTRFVFLTYSVVSYLAFLIVTVYTLLFFAGALVPGTVDGPVRVPPGTAVAIDLAIVLLFALQHSVMARPWFKRAWTRIVPPPIERATYVLCSSAALAIVVGFWQPIDGVVWNVTNPTGRIALWALFGLGWASVPAVSYLINHYDLFGLRQTWLHYQGRRYESLPFRTPSVYGRVRHPLYVAWAVAFWATPTMTLGHAFLATMLTLYMVVATVWEERDLVAHFGPEYVDYQRRVPKFIPRLVNAKQATAHAAATAAESA